MKILVSGASGLVGSSLCARLAEDAHDVTRLVRRSADGPGEVAWNPAEGQLDAGAISGTEAVVHLAGENIAAGRWNDALKRRILESRTQGTGLIAKTLAGLEAPPKVLVSASAIGYYGDRGVEELHEDSAPGEGYLSEVCQAWEAAAQPAIDAGIRVVFLRIGVVLSPDGGALKKMLLPFKLGLAGNLGNGQQYMSWISLPDLVGVIVHALENDALSGPVNAVAPEPVTNAAYTKALGRVLRRPTIFPMPAFAAKAAFGEMADALLLASTRVIPHGTERVGLHVPARRRRDRPPRGAREIA